MSVQYSNEITITIINMGQRFWGRAGSSSNTKLPGLRPSSIPSGILIHAAIWPRQIWAANWGALPLWERYLGPHLTLCVQGRGLPACQVSSWSVQPFGHSARTSQTEQDRHIGQWSHSIAWTVLQTVTQKLVTCTGIVFIHHGRRNIRQKEITQAAKCTSTQHVHI